ncbi:hypothetical protein CN155_08250 [Sinorhizobium meliloti]|nr:hypothetical protein CN155_08250 [Sinorhizobium meliloti]
MAGVAGAPIWKMILMAYAQPSFATLTFKCDHAMREHLVAKQAVVQEPSAKTVAHVEAAEIALLDCQDYDLMRKQLVRWGLSENELSEMSLKAVEERAGTLPDVVRIHEIRY